MLKYYTTNSYHVNRNFIFFSVLLYFSSFSSCTRPKGGMKMQVDRVNFADILVASALGAGLIMTILFEQQELSMSIASGLLGYLGGVKIAGRRP